MARHPLLAANQCCRQVIVGHWTGLLPQRAIEAAQPARGTHSAVVLESVRRTSLARPKSTALPAGQLHCRRTDWHGVEGKRRERGLMAWIGMGRAAGSQEGVGKTSVIRSGLVLSEPPGSMLSFLICVLQPIR